MGNLIIERRKVMKLSGVVFKVFPFMFTVFLFESVALAEYNNRGYGGWGMGPGMMGWGVHRLVRPCLYDDFLGPFDCIACFAHTTAFIFGA